MDKSQIKFMLQTSICKLTTRPSLTVYLFNDTYEKPDSTLLYAKGIYFDYSSKNITTGYFPISKVDTLAISNIGDIKAELEAFIKVII